MTNEEKQLLLKDICARLSHNPFVYSEGCKVECFHKLLGINGYDVRISHVNNEGFPLFIESWMRLEYIKPYLRPMSSMTEEERKEVEELIKSHKPSPDGIINNKGMDNLLFSVSSTSGYLIDWLNKKMFDYRGLIPMGLALEAPEGMYKTE